MQSLYRIFWRWHFYAGLLVGPVLFVVAVTGAIYVFKDELEHVMYAETMFVSPQPTSVSFDDQAAAVAKAFPDWIVDTLEVESDPARATSIRIRKPSASSQRVYVDPHTGAIQGTVGEDSFFRVVLAIHRRLFVGTVGRVVVEIVTCWAIILMVTGIYLWFPRRREKIWGVLAPRLGGKPYVVLRDLHAILGALMAPIALTMAATGLIYSFGWGSIYQYAQTATNERVERVQSVSSPGSPTLSFDRAVAIVRSHAPDATFIDVQLPGKQRGVILARAIIGDKDGPRNRLSLSLDRSTGEVLATKTTDRMPPLTWWRTTWNYPLHVGSVLGLPTKIIWFVACLVLAAMPFTGLWMWWKRRPDGKTGFPRRPNRPVPWWLVALIALLGAALPAVGATILLIVAGEWAIARIRPISTKELT